MMGTLDLAETTDLTESLLTRLPDKHTHWEQPIQLIQHTTDHNCQENSLLEHSSFKHVFSRYILWSPFKSKGIDAYS